MGQVYIIHFREPLSGRARHYVGWVAGDRPEDVRRRFFEHCRGEGARILKVALENQISFRIVRVYPGCSREMERRIKKQKNAWKHCPVCRAERAQGKQLRLFI